MAKKKIWEYPASVTLKNKQGEVVLNVLTQLYQTGVYVAEYGNSSPVPSQLSLSPAQMKKYMGQFKPDNLKDGFFSEFGSTIKVTTDDNDLYVRAE